MNKSMMTGVVAGVAVAMAGGVAAYTYMGKDDQVVRGVATAAAAPKQECWDEQITVEVDPKDRHRIAGTAAGAVLGGAIGKEVGDKDASTIVGAAAGAYIGRRIQGNMQENRADDRSVTTTERRCGPVGSH
jgi:uncharacterized protein YcfJ